MTSQQHEQSAPPTDDGVELISLGEIAEFAGVRRASVSNWRRRHPNFPKPYKDDDQRSLFRIWDIADWLDDRPIPGARTAPLTYGYQFRDRVLRMRAFSGLRDQFSADLLLSCGMALCALWQVAGRLPTNVTAVQTLAHQTELARRELTGVIAPDLDRLPADAASLIETINEMCEFTGAAGTAERLIADADRFGAGIRSELTPPGVADFVAELIGDTTELLGDTTERVIYDPAVGVGNLLLRIARTSSPKRLIAADADPVMGRILRQRFTCHGVAAEFLCQDAVSAPTYQAANLVVVDPPFAGGDAVEPERPGQVVQLLYRWLHQALGQLVPGGLAVALVPAWLLSRTGDTDPAARLRDSLVSGKVLRAALQLPRLSHPFRSGTQLVVLVLTKPIPGSAADTVLICDADRGGGDGTELARAVRRMLCGHDAGLPRDVAWELPRSAASKYRSLLPAHVLVPSSDSRGVVDQVRTLAVSLSETSIFSQLSDVAVTDVEQQRRLVTVGELMSRRMLQMFSGFRIPGRMIGVTGESPVIGARELLGEVAVGERRVSADALGSIPRARLTISGDLIILPINPLRVLIDRGGGSLVENPAQVLRLRPGKLEPHGDGLATDAWNTADVLAAILTAPRNRGRTSGSRVLRGDLAALEIPVIPFTEVMEITALLRELAMLRQQTATRLAALDELSEALGSGVADGMLAVTGYRPAPLNGRRDHGGAT